MRREPFRSESLSKMGTPLPRVSEAFQGSRGQLHEISRGNRTKGAFCHVLFFFVHVKNGYPPPGCRKLFRAAGENRAKGASWEAGELRERGILLCSVSFLVCVKNGYPPLHLGKIFIPPSETLLETSTPFPQGYAKNMSFWISFGTPSRNVPICKKKKSVLKFQSIWTKIKGCYRALKFQWKNAL